VIHLQVPLQIPCV